MSKEIKPDGYVLQPGLWEEPSVGKTNTVETRDPERNLVKLYKDADNRYFDGRNSLVGKEVKIKREELRNRIGLPVARGKDPHINDDFYKFLVRKVFFFDTFGIFREYDRAIDGVPAELDSKINEISGLIDELLNKGLNRPQRFNRFYNSIANIGKKMLKSSNVTICRDSLFTVLTFDFYFKVNIPKPNKNRIITERDKLGRIIFAKTPEIYI